MNIITKPASTETKIPDGVFQETVLEVQHYTETLFKFRTTRPDGFRFRSGEFVMIGLMIDGKPLYRAYSIASPAWGEELEFYSIKVPNGPLTSHLQKIKVGDKILMRKKPTGTLVIDALSPGKRLYMFSTGTGIAPFASLIRDIETYEKFDELILTHTCREISELQYGIDLVEEIKNDEMLSELLDTNKLHHFTSVTREDYKVCGRITDLMKSGELFKHLGLPALDPKNDRAMICGSTAMLKDTQLILEKSDFIEGANNRPADYVIERAFAE
ncbi:MAG: ferredoxin--NADP reductase [Rhodomicrobiaceae bacterium]|jgi:ferredoxin--NADP+ reductase